MLLWSAGHSSIQASPSSESVAFERATETSFTSLALPVELPPAYEATGDEIELTNFEDLARYGAEAHTWSEENYFPFGPLHTTGPSLGECSRLDYGCVARGFYLNDQRIQWSGQEATFAGEGSLYANFRVDRDEWTTSVESEVFLNQPTDKNIFVNTAERRSYAANFDFDPLELSRLNIAVRNGNWELRAGRMWTPFGRHYTQLWSNQLLDAPFIRTEPIIWRETGLLLRWDPGMWVFDAGLFNGHQGRDSNSNKALVARMGAEQDNWALGGSVKIQDGFGSENQKTYNGHVGIDAMLKLENWRLSSEVIYDEYGLRRDTFDPLDIFWVKSIYYRDLNKAPGEPITGVGYYVTLDHEGPLWTTSLSFGQFFPEDIGVVQHDRTQTRGILKFARSFTKNLQAYSAVMMENEGYEAQGSGIRRGTVILTGLQFSM